MEGRYWGEGVNRRVVLGEAVNGRAELGGWSTEGRYWGTVSVTSITPPQIRHHCPRVPIILVGTKGDMRADAEATGLIKNSAGHSLAKKVNTF